MFSFWGPFYQLFCSKITSEDNFVVQRQEILDDPVQVQPSPTPPPHGLCSFLPHSCASVNAWENFLSSDYSTSFLSSNPSDMLQFPTRCNMWLFINLAFFLRFFSEIECKLPESEENGVNTCQKYLVSFCLMILETTPKFCSCIFSQNSSSLNSKEVAFAFTCKSGNQKIPNNMKTLARFSFKSSSDQASVAEWLRVDL